MENCGGACLVRWPAHEEEGAPQDSFSSRPPSRGGRSTRPSSPNRAFKVCFPSADTVYDGSSEEGTGERPRHDAPWRPLPGACASTLALALSGGVYGNVAATPVEDYPMGDTQGIQAWHTRQQEEGKTPVTVWLSREEKRRLEALATTRHCSASELVQQALAQFQPESPIGISSAPDTSQIQVLIQEALTTSPAVTATLTDIITATVQSILRTLLHAEEQLAPVTATCTRNVTETPGTPERVAVAGNSSATETVSQRRPEKDTVVAQLREMRTAGLSFAQMAAQLRQEGLPTLSGRGTWQKGTMAKLLRTQEPPNLPATSQGDCKRAPVP
jgi:hypothetical protein